MTDTDKKKIIDFLEDFIYSLKNDEIEIEMFINEFGTTRNFLGTNEYSGYDNVKIEYKKL